MLGDSAAVVAYGAEWAPTALDALAGEPPAWSLAGTALAHKHGLCLRPAPPPELPSDWKSLCRAAPEAVRFTRLRVLTPTKEDLLLSALSRFSDADRARAAFLAGLPIDRLALIRRYRLMRRHHKGDLRPLDRSFNYVLKEHFSLGPFRF